MAHLLGQDNLMNAEEIISRRFTQKSLLLKALNLSNGSSQEHKNHAQLGDSVINIVLVSEGRHRDVNRDQINRVMSEKASKTYLAQRGFASGLADCIYRNPSQGNTIYLGPMSDTVEAIIGAVFIDSGESLPVARGVMERLGISWPRDSPYCRET